MATQWVVSDSPKSPFKPQVITGTDQGVDSQGHPYYAQGQVKLPNEGQVSDVGPSDDGSWVVSDTPPAAPQRPLLQRMGQATGNFGIGALKGAASSGQGLLSLIAPRGSFFNSDPVPSPPSNTAQRIGKDAEQAAEFLIPGIGEEAATADLARVAPIAAPAARIAYNGLTSGLLNKAQGGNFGTGAAAGAGGGLFAEGAKAAAPAIREFAQGIMTPGSNTGRAMLEERLSGFRPSSIRKSAHGLLDRLNPELDQAAIRAGERPQARIAGLLSPPNPEMEAIPLGKVPENMQDVPGQLVNASRLPSKNVFGGPPDPRNIAQLGERATLPPARLTRNAYVTSTPDEINELNRSGPGVLLRPKASSEVPGIEVPYSGISLGPARTLTDEALNKANLQGEPKLVKGVKRLQKQLMNRGDAGPRPEVVSPYEFLQAKRGVGNAVSAAKWKPGYHDPFTGVQKRVYGAMNDAFENTVPEAAPLNRRISSLIPASKPGSVMFSRFLSPAGGATIGAYEGARAGYGSPKNPDMLGMVRGGLTGAALGAMTGFAVPTMLNAGARILYSPATGRFIVPAVAGGALQAAARRRNNSRP